MTERAARPSSSEEVSALVVTCIYDSYPSVLLTRELVCGESALVTCLMIVTRFFGNVFHRPRLPGLLLAARNSHPLYDRH